MPLVSIIIVNWNGSRHLPECLDSLAAQTFRDFEVIVVDNGSSDGSVVLLQRVYPWVKLVELDRNTGFATGNNNGLVHASGDYIVTLNNDTLADPQWLSILVSVAEANPDAGMIGSRICSHSDRDCIDSLGFGVCRDGMSRGMFRQQKFSSLQLSRVEEVLLPSACVALYRRSMLDKTGFFDDDFFAYAEDTDLGLRCRLAGWNAIVATDAVVYHKYSMTGGSFSPLKLYLVERNHYWVAIKTFPLGMLLQVPFFTLIRYVAQGRAILSGRGSGKEFNASGSRWMLVAALAKGTWDALLGVPKMIAKRRTIMEGRQIDSREMNILLHRYRLSFSDLLDKG